MFKFCDYIIKLLVYYGMKKNDNFIFISDLKRDFEKDKNMIRYRFLSIIRYRFLSMGIEEIRF